jgi:hypothetical protein
MADRGGRTRATVPLPEPVRSEGRPTRRSGHRGRWLLMANDNNFADAAASRLMLVALPEDPALR